MNRTIIKTFILLGLLTGLAGAQHDARLSWDDAVKEMLGSNPESLSSEALKEQYRRKISSAESVLYPQAGAVANYTRANPSSGVEESYSYGLNATYSLYSPSKRSDIRASRLSLAKTEDDSLVLKNKLLFLLRKAFAELLCAQDSLSMAEQTLKRRQDNAALLRLKYNAGRESHAALLETDSLVKYAEWDKDKNMMALKTAQRQLNKVLGRPLSTAVTALEIKSARPPEDFAPFGKYVDGHPSLAGQRVLIDSASEALTRAKSGYLPTADVNANYLFTGYNWPDNEPGWNAGLNLRWNFFTGGQVKADTAAQRAAIAKAMQDLRSSRDSVYVTAEESYYSWRQAYSYVAVQESMLEATRARAWLVQTQYVSGQASYFEWRDVEGQLISTQQQLVTARRDLTAAYAAFIQAIGLGEYPL